MGEEDYKWGEYGDVLFDIKTTMPPGSREPGPVINPNFNNNEEIFAGNDVPITIPSREFTGINSSGVTPNPMINPNPAVNPNFNPTVNPNPITTSTGNNNYNPRRTMDYIPQSTRTRDEMNTLAYGTSRTPQTQQDDTESAYVPQTTRDDEDNDAKYGGFFYGNGGEAEIDLNTYKQLIAAGADIEIL